MTREEKDGSLDDTLLPDQHNSEWYCRVCKKYKKIKQKLSEALQKSSSYEIQAQESRKKHNSS